MTHECPRESDLLDSIHSMQWPERADSELRAHVTACPSCSELLVIATAFARDYDEALHAAAIPSAGAVWFRAQRRARADAIGKATRTMFLIQGLSIAAAMIVVIALLGGTAALPLDWSTLARQLSDARAMITISTPIQWTVPMAIAIAATAAFAPVALYLAVARD